MIGYKITTDNNYRQYDDYTRRMTKSACLSAEDVVGALFDSNEPVMEGSDDELSSLRRGMVVMGESSWMSREMTLA